ncbi:nucleotidyl transferase AbiEii/AbiGii toxin family protein [Thalassospira profundimaris]|uniref:nucleotidyl transferase AbiEii/AbiGii toxin family protein n=1 Tax=Thalassospira profundimaris TaxID=502049 RepID=UPI000688D3A4|nr:nucleotidyl transferase AbiEii/AbiGii toxin family protein [Thalassospira profundimaris]
MLFILWTGEPYRATRDLDLLGFGERDIEALTTTFRALCDTPVEEDDGLEFITESVQVEPMRDEEGHPGARVRLEAQLASARLSVQVDIGFGDAVTPKAEEIESPSLLALPAPRIRAYPRETVVAEKYEAIVSLGMLNSRMKDFYDLWVLASSFPFDGQTLAPAVRVTFDRRGTALPEVTPVGLSDEFAGDRGKQQQWQAFQRRGRPALPPPALPDVVGSIREFLTPLTEALRQGQPFDRQWSEGGSPGVVT